MKFHTLEDFSVRMSETDAAGLVHFSHFLRWAENAEGDFFRKNGLSVFEKTAAGTCVGWPRVAAEIRFLAPARYADRIRVRIRPEVFPPNGARSIRWRFEISRAEKNGSETPLANGAWTSVFAEIGGNAEISVKPTLPSEFLSAVKSFF